MKDLTSTYMGLMLRSPIVVSACPLSEQVDNIVQMEDAGAGAVVLFSLFEEQLRQEMAAYESVLDATSNTFAEALDYFPGLEDYHVGPDQYLEIIRQVKARVDIPIIASLNGITDTGWIDYAQQMETAGADGIELNVFYIPADLALTGTKVEARYLDIVSRIKTSVSVPVAIKLNPYFSAMGNMAQRLADAGADGLVLFNRFYQPDFDIRALKVLSNLEYSHANEIRLPLLWISVLYGKIHASLAATTGVQSATEAIKYLLAGADAVMTASSLYQHGINHLATITQGMEEWMEMLDFQSVSQFKGVMSQQNTIDPSAFERANYIRILEGRK